MQETDITINRYPIRLGQFLKLANIVSDGLEAKTLLSDAEVLVNDQVETRRGRKLLAGDRVKVRGNCYACV